MATLVIDTGTESTVGIFSVDDGMYTYYSAASISEALERIAEADEVVTYNGNYRDLADLIKFAGPSSTFRLRGVHTDMRSICWSDRILGSNLGTTYRIHFSSVPIFPDSHEGSIHLDVYMTYKLWSLWKTGKLKIIDGQHV